MTLRRFWVRFDPQSETLIGFRMGCGITARNQDEALELMQSVKGYEPSRFKVLEVVPDIAVDKLDPKHILPNIGDVTRRGIWFPNLGGSQDD